MAEFAYSSRIWADGYCKDILHARRMYLNTFVSLTQCLCRLAAIHETVSDIRPSLPLQAASCTACRDIAFGVPAALIGSPANSDE